MYPLDVEEFCWATGVPSADSSFFKLYMSDVGLLTCSYGMNVVRDLMNDRVDINYGSIYENYTAQEFAAHGLCHPAPDLHLYFFRNRKMGELDFVVESSRGHVVPIEVKSGKSTPPVSGGFLLCPDYLRLGLMRLRVKSHHGASRRRIPRRRGLCPQGRKKGRTPWNSTL